MIYKFQYYRLLLDFNAASDSLQSQLLLIEKLLEWEITHYHAVNVNFYDF